MRIGILTYSNSHNIGSMLQSLALQDFFLQKYDVNVEFINYSSPAQKNMYSIFPKIVSLKDFIKNSISLIFYMKFKARFNDFENFKQRYLIVSDGFFEQSKDIPDSYDLIVLGSDQIWNVNCLDFTSVYLGNFQHTARIISYAASLGGQDIRKSSLSSEYSKFISRLDDVSVREENGAFWLKDLISKNIEIVPDPTILIEDQYWHSLVEDQDQDYSYGDYIFFYGVPFSKKTYSAVELISKKLGLKVVMMDPKSYIYNLCYFKGFILHKGSSPLDFLYLIKRAKIVLTTSYHGTIFSTIFNKNFWTITFKETNIDDDRIEYLLKQLGLEQRMIYMEDFQDFDLLQSVDYESNNYKNKVSGLRSIGHGFISRNIKVV